MPATSVEGQILEALRDRFRPVLSAVLSESEVEMRDDYFGAGGPYRGLSLHLLDEVYEDGTIGTHDCCYIIAATFCSQKTEDASYSGNGPALWRQLVRQNMVDRRIASLSASVPQHVVKLMPGTRKAPKDFTNWDCSQLLLYCWTRELPSTEV